MIGTLAHERLANHAVGNSLLRLVPLVAGGGLRTYLQNALGLLHGVDQLARLFDGVAHRLFEVNVLAQIHCSEGDLGVPVVRRGYNHCVHVVPGEQFAVIEVAFYFIDVLVLFLALLINVADGDDLGVAFFCACFRELAGYVSSAATASDDADVDFVVGADDASGLCRTSGERGARQAQGGAYGGCGFQEVSSIYGVIGCGHG